MSFAPIPGVSATTAPSQLQGVAMVEPVEKEESGSLGKKLLALSEVGAFFTPYLLHGSPWWAIDTYCGVFFQTYSYNLTQSDRDLTPLFELQMKYYAGSETYQKGGPPDDLNKALQALFMGVFANEKKEIDPDFQLLLDELQKLLKTESFDNLQVSLEEFFEEKLTSDWSRYRSAILACKGLHSAAVHFCNLYFYIEQKAQLTNFYELTNKLSRVEKIIIEGVAKAPLSEGMKKDLTSAHRKLYHELATLLEELDAQLKAFNPGEATASLVGPVVDKITGLDFNEASDKEIDLHYVQEHITVFRGFIRRMRKVFNQSTELVARLEKIALFFTYYPSYLQIGSLQQLQENIEKKGVYSQRWIKETLLKEVNTFGCQIERGENVLRLIQLFREPEMQGLRDLRDCGKKIVLFSQKISTALQGLFPTSLAASEALYNDLFTKPPAKIVGKRATRRKKANGRKKANQRKSGGAAGPKALSLQEGHRRYCQSLSRRCKSPGAPEAINNAREHFRSFLRVFERLSALEDGSFYRETLLCTTLSLVRSGHYAVEQLLTALEIEGSPGEELRQHFSHNLALLLSRCYCDFEGADLQIQQLIEGLNFGEYAERNLPDCGMEGNRVEKLLTTAWRFCQRNELFTKEVVLKRLFKFGCDVADLYIQLLSTFMNLS